MTNRNIKISILLNAEEKRKFLEGFERSSYSGMSAYARTIILGEPVQFYYRDRAFDDFVEAAIDFRKDVLTLLQRSEWSEVEKDRVAASMSDIYQLLIKIDKYVRENKKNKKRS